jgi:hypothetical protein
MTLPSYQRYLIPVILAWGTLAAPSQTTSKVPEYQAKATILRAVGNYTRWPEGAATDPSKPFIIGILGSSPFGHHLEEQLRDQQVRGRRISLLTMRTLNVHEVTKCDLLFICESESERLAEILETCKNRPILTLGDTPGYGRRRVMLNITFDSQLLGLEVNLKAIRDAGLEVSSPFLKIARAKVVEPS